MLYYIMLYYIILYYIILCYIYMNTYVCGCVCIYIYIDIYMYIHTSTWLRRWVLTRRASGGACRPRAQGVAASSLKTARQPEIKLITHRRRHHPRVQLCYDYIIAFATASSPRPIVRIGRVTDPYIYTHICTHMYIYIYIYIYKLVIIIVIIIMIIMIMIYNIIV